MSYSSGRGADDPGTATYDDDTPLSQQDNEAVAAAAHDCINKAERIREEWAKEAKLHYDMVAGWQWDEKDERIMRDNDRVPITFNRVGALVDAICGSQVNNRQEVKLLPRTQDDSAGAEHWQGALSYVSDECDAEDECSESFRDLAITGMGWTINRLDYTEDDDGQLIKERLDPLEMYWDPSSQKKNLADAKWFARKSRVSRAEIKARWPEYGFSIDVSSRSTSGRGSGHDGRRDDYGADSEATGEHDVDTDEIVEYQWCETYTVYVVGNPETGAVEILDGEAWARLGEQVGREQRDQIRHVTQSKRRWYRAFVCGDDCLERGDSPDPEASTFGCMTGKRDRNKRMWYGIVRPIVQPQKWANKWMSQSLHIINAAAKGGLLVEEGAVPDIRKFEDEYARTGAISVVGDGALGRGAIIPKPVPQFPAGFDRLLQFAFSSIPDVSGINKEMMGLTDRDQAGVLEWQRKQAGQAVLAPLFDALRLFYKRDGRQMMRLISAFMPPDKVFRVAAEAESEPKLVQRAMLPDFRKFDIVVDQAPTSPNAKMEVWGYLQPILPQLIKLGLPPPVMAELIRYSPLPESAVAKIIKGWTESTQQQGPPPEVQKMQAEMQLKQQEAAMKQQQAEVELQLKIREAELEMQIEMAKFQQKMVFEQHKAAQDADIRAANANAAIDTKRREAEARLSARAPEDRKLDSTQAESMKAVMKAAEEIASAAKAVMARRKMNGQASRP